MSTRPEVNKQFRTRNGKLIRITQDLGRMGFEGYTVEPAPHVSIWNNEGDNQEYMELDLVEEETNATSHEGN